MDTQNAGNLCQLPASKMSAAVTFRNVTQHFDSLWGGRQVRALIDVSLDIHRGEVFGLLGPSRSGKSTAIRLITGQLSPMEGSVKVFAHSPRRRTIRARVGWLRPERQAAGSVAQLLLRKSELVVLDEPFAGLDSGARAELKELIRSTTRSSGTVIIATQSLLALKDVCDRLAVFAEGKVKAVGPTSALIASPDTLPWLLPTLPRSLCERLAQAARIELDLDNPVAGPQSILHQALLPGFSPASQGLEIAARFEASAVLRGDAKSAADPAASAAEEILARLVKAPEQSSTRIVGHDVRS